MKGIRYVVLIAVWFNLIVHFIVRVNVNVAITEMNTIRDSNVNK